MQITHPIHSSIPLTTTTIPPNPKAPRTPWKQRSAMKIPRQRRLSSAGKHRTLARPCSRSSAAGAHVPNPRLHQPLRAREECAPRSRGSTALGDRSNADGQRGRGGGGGAREERGSRRPHEEARRRRRTLTRCDILESRGSVTIRAVTSSRRAGRMKISGESAWAARVLPPLLGRDFWTAVWADRRQLAPGQGVS